MIWNFRKYLNIMFSEIIRIYIPIFDTFKYHTKIFRRKKETLALVTNIYKKISSKRNCCPYISLQSKRDISFCCIFLFESKYISEKKINELFRLLLFKKEKKRNQSRKSSIVLCAVGK